MHYSFFKRETIIVDDFLTPEGIYEHFFSNTLSKDEATERAISLFESSDDSKFRARCLETLDKIVLEKEKIFKFLESCLISDENWIVRATAAEVLINSILIKSESPIKWAIENDKSYPCVFRIFKALEDTKKDDSNVFLNLMKDKFIKNYQKKFNLNWREAIVLGMLDMIRNDPEVGGEIKPDFSFKVEQGHVVELTMEGIQYDEFEGLELFPKLKILEIMGENLQIVKNIEVLINLTTLNVYDAQIESIKMFESLENLEELGLYNNKITDTSGIEKLKNLKKLDLGCNPITSIEGLDKLNDLNFLNIHFDAGSGPISEEKRKEFEKITNKVLNNKARTIMMYLFLD